MGKDAVGHPNLVGGGETSLHTHAGGGGGPTIKSGTITVDGGGLGSVVFLTPFVDVNYAVGLSADGTLDAVIATWANKTVDGFDVQSRDDKGLAEGNAIVNWVAISFSNL